MSPVHINRGPGSSGPVRGRRRAGTTLIAAIAMAAASPLAAQQDAPASPAAEAPCACSLAPEGTARSIFPTDRAHLGVLLGDVAEVDGRTGVRVEDVTDGGPAERAGISAGDVLLSVDGRELGTEPVDVLMEILGQASAGDTVDVAFSRDGRQHTAPVTLGRTDRFAFRGPPAMPPAPRPFREMSRMRPEAPSAILTRLQGALRGGPELVAMNDRLGEYFGVSEGVLVVDVPEESTLALEPGDVITGIGGRSVDDAAHARSILGSYRPDETITLEIVRDGERTTVTGTRSDRRARRR